MSQTEEVPDTTEENDKAEKDRLAKRELAAAWLDQNWIGIRQCAVCTTNKWTIGDIVELRLYQGGGLVVGGPIYPLFPVICDKCGNTLFINALRAGALERPSEESDDGSDTSS